MRWQCSSRAWGRCEALRTAVGWQCSSRVSRGPLSSFKDSWGAANMQHYFRMVLHVNTELGALEYRKGFLGLGL